MSSEETPAKREWAWKVLAALGLVLAIMSAGLLLWKLPHWQILYFDGATDFDERTRFELENEARRTLAQILLGLGGLIALYVAWRRVRAMDATARAAQRSADAANENV